MRSSLAPTSSSGVGPSAGVVPDPLVLEELAAASDVVPIAARRTQAMLGGSPHLDAIDRAVLKALAERAGPMRVETVFGGPLDKGAEPWRRGWGLDDARQAAWVPGRGTVALASKKLFWRFLSTLADQGGRATKEELAAKVWDAHDYHPLRDDKRMQVAVHKLRALIENDVDRPERLVTTDDGYGFGGGEPVRRLRVS